MSGGAPGSGSGGPSGDRLVSHYRVLAPIGRGGMGTVYEAEDTRLGRRVAIKFLSSSLASDPRAVARFLREARAASTLSHRHVCRVLDVGEDGAERYIVMERLEGRTLRSAIAGRAMAVPSVLELGAQMAEGLEAAHAAGIVHRDVKPANVLLTRDGAVKLTDFGLAKIIERPPTVGEGTTDSAYPDRLTRDGAAIGTVGYMSPEQARGEEVDARTDLFSLGAVLYEMATGRPPFGGATDAVAFEALLARDPPPARSINPAVPSALEAILAKALEKDRSMRYQSAADLKVDLLRARRPQPSPGGTPGSEPLAGGGRTAWRYRSAVAIPLLLALALGAAASRPSGSIRNRGSRSSRSAAAPYSARASRRTAARSSTAPCGTGSRRRSSPGGWKTPPRSRWDSRRRPSSRCPRGRSWPCSWPPRESMARCGSARSRGSRSPEAPCGPSSTASATPTGLRTVASWRSSAGVTATSSSSIPSAPFSCGRVRRRGCASPPTGSESPFSTTRTASCCSTDPGTRPASGWPAGGRGSPGRARARRSSWTPASRTCGGASGAWGATVRSARCSPSPARSSSTTWGEDGRVLVHHGFERWDVRARRPDETGEREASAFANSGVAGLSADGSRVLLWHHGEGPPGLALLQSTEGGPPLRIGEGRPHGLSADGRHVVMETGETEGPRLSVVPTGTGESRPIPAEGLERFSGVWHVDEHAVGFHAAPRGQRRRSFLARLPDGTPRPITPEGTVVVPGSLPSGDLVARSEDGTLTVYPAAGGEGRALPWRLPADPFREVVRVSGDGRYLFVKEGSVPARVDRLDLRTGERGAWMRLGPSDETGVGHVWSVLLTPDGRGYAYTHGFFLQDLFLVEGLR